MIVPKLLAMSPPSEACRWVAYVPRSSETPRDASLSDRCFYGLLLDEVQVHRGGGNVSRHSDSCFIISRVELLVFSNFLIEVRG